MCMGGRGDGDSGGDVTWSSTIKLHKYYVYADVCQSDGYRILFFIFVCLFICQHIFPSLPNPHLAELPMYLLGSVGVMTIVSRVDAVDTVTQHASMK